MVAKDQAPEVMQADLNGSGGAEAKGQPLLSAQAVENREQEGADLEEEEDEEEEEPRLKYQRLGSSVTEILRQDAASCLCVSDKLLALGTHDGTIHVLDFAGNEVGKEKMSDAFICMADFASSTCCLTLGALLLQSRSRKAMIQFKISDAGQAL